MIKKTFLTTVVIFITFNLCLQAQENLNITAPGIIPAPLDLEANGGEGCAFFSIQNVNLPGYPNTGDTEVLIKLNNITPKNGIGNLSSSLAESHYSWTYNAETNTFKGVQKLPIGFLYSEVITFCFEVTTNSYCPNEDNGYMATGIVINGVDGNVDDNIAASYTCTSDQSSLQVDLNKLTSKQKD